MKTKLVLFLIIGLGFLLRVVWLDQYPIGFTADEAQQGYDAYSILKTGKDGWGETLPMFPRGFGDYKPPLYTYLTIPSVALFGLNEFSTRFPAVMIGTISIVVVYFLTKEYFGKNAGFWAALLMAINPWSIQLSRTAFEGGVGILFFSLGLLFYLKSKLNKYLLILSFICMGLTLYTYHGWRVITAGIMVVITVYETYHHNISKQLIVALFVFGLFLAPLVFNLSLITKRSSDVGIISSKSIENFFKNKTTSDLPPIVDKLIDNKYSHTSGVFFSNYLSYFSPTFFFTGSRSDSSYLNFPNTPLLYGIEILTLGAGLYLLFKKRYPFGFVLITWLFLAPVAAALTDSFNANRAVSFMPLPVILSGLGAATMIEYFEKEQKFKKYSTLVLPVFLICLAGGLVLFLYAYYYSLVKNPSHNLRYGYKPVFEYILQHADGYYQIHFSKNFSMSQIFVAFYSTMLNNNEVSIEEFQLASQDWKRYEMADKLYVDQLESYNLGKYHFHDLDWRKDSQRGNVLLVGAPDNFPEEVQSELDVKNPKGEIIYRVVSPFKNQ